MSNYEEATVHILSAFFCITGDRPADRRLRKDLETLLINLNKAELTVTPSNIVKFCCRSARTDN